MTTSTGDVTEMAQEARLALVKERERLSEKVKGVDDMIQFIDAMNNAQAERDALKKEVTVLRGQLKEEKEQREKVEMQLKEMSKLSASVAGKASQDELLKVPTLFFVNQ